MVREAAQISVVPLIKAAKPVPEPPPVTEISTSGWDCIYASAHSIIKYTMVSDPLIVSEAALRGPPRRMPESPDGWHEPISTTSTSTSGQVSWRRLSGQSWRARIDVAVIQ